MGVFEKVMQERHPPSEGLTLTPRQAFAAIVVGAFNADGRNAPEEVGRVNEIFNSTRLFRRPPVEPVEGIFKRVSELFRTYGADEVMALAARVMPPELRAPVFAVAVDLVLADGEASLDERRFIDDLQGLLQIPDEEAMKIVDVMVVKNSV